MCVCVCVLEEQRKTAGATEVTEEMRGERGGEIKEVTREMG